MGSLLTLSLGEYRYVELALKLVVTLIGMMAVLLALSASGVAARFRLPLFLTAVALGGAAWFEYGVFDAWRDAFELAGTSYCVTGHLLDSEGRIIAWSLGVPAILFSFGLVRGASGRVVVSKRTLFLAAVAMAVVTPFSSAAGGALFCFLGVLLVIQVASATAGKSSLYLALASVASGMLLNAAGSHYSFGGGPEGELVRGEIVRSIIDLFSLVIPASLLLIGVPRLSQQEVEFTKSS
jgi:hypothetical protein